MKNYKEKPHSPRNGEIVNGNVYDRIYDFSRDAWYDLIYKLTSPTWNKGSRVQYLPMIKRKLFDRIRNGSCTLEEVTDLIERRIKKSGNPQILKDISKIKSVTKKKTNKKTNKKKYEVIKDDKEQNFTFHIILNIDNVESLYL